MISILDTNMVAIIVATCLIVLIAMIVDLVSGLMKAKQRGEVRSSWGLKRSLNKFIMYEGGILIGGGIDILVYCCKLLEILGFESLRGVPIITCLIGVFLCVVELISVREKADKKTKTEFSRVQQIAENLVSKSDLIDALTEAIKKAKKDEK